MVYGYCSDNFCEGLAFAIYRLGLLLLRYNNADNIIVYGSGRGLRLWLATAVLHLVGTKPTYRP